jgi:hypothetical protein
VFADLTAKLVRAGDGDDFVAIGGQVALDSEHGWMLADVLPPMLHIDGSSTEASTMRYFLEFLQLLVGKIGWSDPYRVLRHDIVLDRLLTMAGAGGAYCSRWRERVERAVPVLSFAKCTMLMGPARRILAPAGGKQTAILLCGHSSARCANAIRISLL